MKNEGVWEDVTASEGREVKFMDQNEHDDKPKPRKREPQLLVTPIRLLVKLAVRIAPERYKARVRKGGKKMTTHGFSDAAVILTLLYDAGATLVLIVALLVLGLFFSMMEE